MGSMRWLYARVELIGEQAKTVVLMPNGAHSVTTVGSLREVNTVIAQMGADGWELVAAYQVISATPVSGNMRAGEQRLWFKKPLEG